MTALSPLTDITNLRRVQSNIQAGCYIQPSPAMSRSSMESSATHGLSPETSFASPMSPHQSRTSAFDFGTPAPHTPMFTMPSVRPAVHRHDPYNWKCLPENDQQATMLLAQRASHFAATQRQRKGQGSFHVGGAPQRPIMAQHAAPALNPMHPHSHQTAPASAPAHHVPGTLIDNCRILVQFKCHHGEFASMVNVEKGQYVVVQGDRGMDIGVVIRVNTEAQKTYIERTGPCGSVMRHATQREVDYWASELKADEQAALDFCQRRVVGNDLVMEVRHAEYQFDKKKLTFYYDAKSRVDFVGLLKDLYREFGCRIWMEKVRTAEISPNA